MTWQDQSFELHRDGQLVAELNNTAEYQQALR